MRNSPMNCLSRRRFIAGSLLIAGMPIFSAGANEDKLAVQTGDFRWKVGPPVLSAAERPNDPCYSVKDPTIVRLGDRWHLFCTIRSLKRTHQIEYLSFADWTEAYKAKRHILTMKPVCLANDSMAARCQ